MIHPRHSDAWASCRIVEIAWMKFDARGNCLHSRTFLIRPNGYVIPEQASRVHGISTEQAARDGVELNEALHILKDDLITTKTIVAHNFKFDNNVILSEILRAKDDQLANMWTSCDHFCTMLHAAASAPGGNGLNFPSCILGRLKKNPM
jgi:DNA polymerase III epsilon subunit-like protein